MMFLLYLYYLNDLFFYQDKLILETYILMVIFMKDMFVLMVKGFLIGIGKIIPGVSGGMIAISMGLYEKMIYAVGYLFHDFKRNVQFLLVLGIGAVLAIVVGSRVIEWSLARFYIPTMFLFIGLIMGGIPGIAGRVGGWGLRHYFLFGVMLSLVLFLTFFRGNRDELMFDQGVLSFFSLVGIGFMDASTMVIPGISGTAIMMMIGFYSTFLSCLSTIFDLSLFSYNMMILIPFGTGVILGVFLISRMIAYFFRYYATETYASITGFAVSSVICLFLQTFSVGFDFSFLIGIAFLLFGYLGGRILDK